jgi:hypothetical protein
VEEPDQVVGPPGAKELAVAGVVADEGELGEHHRQPGGDAQLPPGLAEHGEGQPPSGQQSQVDADLGRVPAAPPLQQAGLLDLLGELGVLGPPACG